MVIVYQEGFGNGPLGRELFAKQTFESSTLPFFFLFFFSPSQPYYCLIFIYTFELVQLINMLSLER